jgi:hypothetical protein
VIRRFQIEDLIAQDGSGVVFKALDTETGQTVAVRRFFPFGSNGGGLLDGERAAYEIGLGRIAGLAHPALRSVICGGCDPVDGIPFIATEWIEGATLESIVRQQHLPADVATLLLTQALEVCELISQMLAEEAVWVETHLSTIMLGDEASGRGFTFWICPLKWLGRHNHDRGLASIIALTEKIMGWNSRTVHDEAGRGLGAWLKWLRSAAPATTLREARENLAAAVGAEPPPPAAQLVTAAKRQPKRPPKPKSSKHVVLAGLGLFLVAGSVGGWLVTRNRSMAQPPELAARTSEAENEPLPEAEPTVARSSRVFSPAESALLIKEKDRTVTLEGRLAKTGTARANKTTYLYFSGQAPAKEVRGVLPAQKAAGFNAAPLIGKKIRITGKVQVVKARPEIVIAHQADIQVAE